jgi:DNA-binding transcriptional LysR family regulator
MADRDQRWDSRIGRRLRLRDLHILSVVVQWGSMAQAATHLAMSQPAVSDAIAALESALRVRLLDRSPKGIEPTLYAQALLKRCNVVFDELRQGVRDIESLADPAVGEVRVASPETFASGLLPAAIDRLSRRYPRIVVRVVQVDTSTVEFRELRERKIDFALARIHSEFREDDLEAEVLFQDTHRVVASTRSRWARRRKISLVELVNEPWIFPATQVIDALIGEAFAVHGLQTPQERVSASSILLRNHLLATGRFLTVLPDSVVRLNATQWSVKALPIDLGANPRPVAVVSLKNRTVTPAAQLLITHLRAVANTMVNHRA